MPDIQPQPKTRKFNRFSFNNQIDLLQETNVANKLIRTHWLSQSGCPTLAIRVRVWFKIRQHGKIKSLIRQIGGYS